MSKLSKLLKINPSAVRTREFEFAGQKFRLRVPLASEAEEMFKKADSPSQELVDAMYEEMAAPLLARRDEIEKAKADITFKEDDILVGEISLKDNAKLKAGGQLRVLESFKLLVTPTGETLGDITFEEIQEEFPEPVQIAMVKKIAEVISPSYEEIRKN